MGTAKKQTGNDDDPRPGSRWTDGNQTACPPSPFLLHLPPLASCLTHVLTGTEDRHACMQPSPGCDIVIPNLASFLETAWHGQAGRLDKRRAQRPFPDPGGLSCKSQAERMPRAPPEETWLSDSAPLTLATTPPRKPWPAKIVGGCDVPVCARPSHARSRTHCRPAPVSRFLSSSGTWLCIWKCSPKRTQQWKRLSRTGMPDFVSAGPALVEGVVAEEQDKKSKPPKGHPALVGPRFACHAWRTRALASTSHILSPAGG